MAGRPFRQIRADLRPHTLVVYQAYSFAIAEPALRLGRFASPFSRDRMTWIKPSFLWMAYRCGWGTKAGQEHVLAVEITRAGFEWALAHSALSHFDPTVHEDHAAWRESLSASPVRIQWDPERDVHLRPLDQRSLQVGLGGEAIHRYVDDWIVSIEDVTNRMQAVQQAVEADRGEAAEALLPIERPYPLPDDLAGRIGATRTA